MSIIQTENVSRSYTVYERVGFMGKKARTVHALQGLNLEIERGDFLGYIGPNGAGKSTTIKLLTGILKPSGGKVSILGYDPHRQRKAYVRKIGAVFGQKTQLWWDLPVCDSYELLRGIHQIPKSTYLPHMEKLKEKLELEEIWMQPVRQLSLGQRMRAELAAALVHQPEILFLDEPTIGLDIVTKRKVKTFLKQLNDEGMTIVLTSHDLGDIEDLCRTLLILDRGQVVYRGDVKSLNTVTSLPTLVVSRLSASQPQAESQLRGFIDQYGGEWDSDRLELKIHLPQSMRPTEMMQMLLKDLPVEDIRVEEPDIEEIIHTIFLDQKQKVV